MSENQIAYYSYLLRLWHVPDEGDDTWRASLENPQTGVRTGFASLDAMYDFLRRQIGLALDFDEGEEVNCQDESKGEN
jgi:hypothetical protein